jgi:hypothetical protein
VAKPNQVKILEASPFVGRLLGGGMVALVILLSQ